LDTSEMTADQLSDLELAVNEKIRSGCKMFPTLYDSKDDPLLLDVRRVENSFFALIVSLIC